MVFKLAACRQFPIILLHAARALSRQSLKKHILRGSSSMNNKQFRVLMMILAALAIGSILFAACTRPGTPGTSSSTASGGSSTPSSSGGGGTGSNGCPSGTAHMVVSNFAQPCVNVSKGSMLNLVDDGNYYHSLDNGSWVNGNAQPANEPGAPTVNNVVISSGSKQVGPFNTAGTYHIYCSVHENMNLLIHVS